jgi:hypothetical protein
MTLYKYIIIYFYMIITPYYACRNCHKIYPGSKVEIANTPIDKLVPLARFTLGTQEHVFKIGGKAIQMSDLHICNAHEVGLANFLRLEFEMPTK